ARTAALAVTQSEPVELRLIGGAEPPEIAVELFVDDECGLDLRQRTEQRVREARRRSRGGKLVKLGLRNGAADSELTDRRRRDPSDPRCPGRELLEEIVERADPSRKEDGRALQQVALDTVDIRPVRHDEPRIVLDRLEKPVQE